MLEYISISSGPFNNIEKNDFIISEGAGIIKELINLKCEPSCQRTKTIRIINNPLKLFLNI